jgi:hypothetical protein
MDIKKKLLDSIQRAQADHSVTLVWNDWGSFDDKMLCPIGCLLLEDNPENMDFACDGEGVELAAAILEVDSSWIISFIEGYDHIGLAKMANNVNAWTLGYELHDELKPAVYGQLPKITKVINDKRK